MRWTQAAPPPRTGRPRRWSGAWSRLAVLPAAAFAVHQLRYKIAFGGASGHVEAETGHAYLGSVLPWVLLAAAFAIMAGVGRLCSGPGAAGAGRRRSPLRLWLGLVVLLVATFAAQEYVEGLLASGHPGGLGGVFGAGGWWAVPAAMIVAGVLVLTLRGERALALALVGRPAPLAPAPSAPPARRWAQPWRTPASPLGSSAAGRAPPLAA